MWSILMCQPMVCQGTTLLTSLAIQTDHIPHAPMERATHLERASYTEPHIQSSRGRDDHIRRVTGTWGNVWAAADHWSAFNQTSYLSSFWPFSIQTNPKFVFISTNFYWRYVEQQWIRKINVPWHQHVSTTLPLMSYPGSKGVLGAPRCTDRGHVSQKF